jgi:hypothetical protein
MALPKGYPEGAATYRDKARASLITSGVFFAFAIAVLAAVLGSDGMRRQVTDSANGLGTWNWPATAKWVAIAVVAFLPFAVIWTERQLSRIRIARGSTTAAYVRLALLMMATVALFGVVPFVKQDISIKDVAGFYFRDVFVVAGLGLLLFAIFLLFISIEFYDTASGWRGSPAFHFHLERIGSHSYVLGMTLALVGLFLALSAVSDALGRLLAIAAIIVAVTLTEIERSLTSVDNSATSHDGFGP